MKKSTSVTDEQWELCNDYNKQILEEFLTNSLQFSPQTKKVYKSNLMIWFDWIRENIDNKPQYELKSVHFMRFQNWLTELGRSSSDINNKRAAISSLNNYILLYYSDDYPTFKNFIFKGVPRPENKAVREKIPPTSEEMDKLITELESRGEWQKLAYVMYTFDTGCRRAESIQLLKEVVDYKPIVKTKKIHDDNGDIKEVKVKYYLSNKTRCKGKGKTGKVRKLAFGDKTMDAVKKWLKIRGDDDCPYVFVSNYKGMTRQITESAINKWASGLFTDILGRRINPHIFRAAKATISIVEEGKSIESVQHLLGHESSQTTTDCYVVNENTDDLDELFLFEEGN